MPRTRSLTFSELRIGALAVTAMIITAVVIVMLGGQGGFFWQRYHLKTVFAEVPGLKPGAPVRVAGVETGSVTDITLVGSHVEVEFTLSRAVQPRVTSRSTAVLGSLSLLGQSTVDIRTSTEGTPIPEWGYVPSGPMPGQLGTVATSATAGLEELTGLVRGLREGKGTIGRLFTDEALYGEIQGMIKAAEAVVVDLQRGRGTVGKLITDPSAFKAFDASLVSLNAMLSRINAGEGSLGRLMQDDRLATSLTSASGNVDTVTRRLANGEGSVGKLMTQTELYDRVNALASRLDQLLERLGQGQGTAGQLLQDRQLYENMNGAASELRGLIGEIRTNPKKFLKISLF